MASVSFVNSAEINKNANAGTLYVSNGVDGAGDGGSNGGISTARETRALLQPIKNRGLQ